MILRPLRRSDAAPVHALVRDSGVLEPNTLYAYLLLCTDFAETGIVAERDGEIIGFVLGYRPPKRPDVIFVWQVGVRDDARGDGLATRLLTGLVDQLGPSVRHLEATVAPSNTASNRLFSRFAERRGAELHVQPGFFESDFGASDHEAEERYRITPLRPSADKNTAGSSAAGASTAPPS